MSTIGEYIAELNNLFETKLKEGIDKKLIQEYSKDNFSKAKIENRIFKELFEYA